MELSAELLALNEAESMYPSQHASPRWSSGQLGYKVEVDTTMNEASSGLSEDTAEVCCCISRTFICENRDVEHIDPS